MVSVMVNCQLPSKLSSKYIRIGQVRLVRGDKFKGPANKEGQVQDRTIAAKSDQVWRI